MYLVKAAKMTFVQKICMFKVDEIDSRGQFYCRSIYATQIAKA
jgi:hypothetical protein